jgi:hypothetical protein
VVEQALGAEQVDLELAEEVVGRRADGAPRLHVPGAADEHLDGPELVLGLAGEGGHGGAVVQVEGQGHRLAAGGPDLLGRLLDAVLPAGAEDDREAGCAERDRRGPAEPRGRAGDHRRPALRVGGEAGHGYLVRTVVGSVAKPRTFTECTRSTPSWWTS